MLNGDSWYNFVINSDLTVSCNCNDRFDFGQIGDFKSQGLCEIFSGEKAIMFRKKLANGRPPNINCSSCPDLVFIDKMSAEKTKGFFKFPQAIY